MNRRWLMIVAALGCGGLLAAGGALAAEGGATEAPAIAVDPAAAEATAAAGPELASPTGALPAEGDGAAAVSPAGAPPVGGAAGGDLLQPAPLDLQAISAGDERNPFIEPPISLAELIPRDYLKVANGLRLHGIVDIAGERLALFNLDAAEGGGKKTTLNLRRYRAGDTIRLEVEGMEYHFSLHGFESRAVLLVGGDKRDYRVWL
jgi:hypothetical protein